MSYCKIGGDLNPKEKLKPLLQVNEWASYSPGSRINPVISRWAPSLVHRALACPQVGRLDFWWYVDISFCPLAIGLPPFWWLALSPVLYHCPCWPRAGGVGKESMMFRRTRSQWQMQWQKHNPFPAFFWRSKNRTGQWLSARLFPSTISPGLECAWVWVYCWK